jgi:hypothetical protein
MFGKKKNSIDGGWIYDTYVTITDGLYTGKIGRVHGFSKGIWPSEDTVMVAMEDFIVEWIPVSYVEIVDESPHPEYLKW